MSNTKSEPVQIAFALPHRPSPKVDPVIFGESLTEQSHKESCDINNIITAATSNPMLLADPAPDRKIFRDFSSGDNYLELQNQLCEAQSTFNDLPSDVRHYFENDPAKVINFISDPNNALEAHEMGLITLDENSLEALRIVNDVSDTEETKTPPELKPEASEA
jgi:hypothetical protein